MEYALRFVRLAARYEEDLYGSTKIGYPSSTFSDGPGGYTQLGSGLMFLDDSAGAKELVANANRIEGWRRTKMYEYYSAVCTQIFAVFIFANLVAQMHTVVVGFSNDSSDQGDTRLRFASSAVASAEREGHERY